MQAGLFAQDARAKAHVGAVAVEANAPAAPPGAPAETDAAPAAPMPVTPQMIVGGVGTARRRGMRSSGISR
jgi:hypothetical protein